MNNKDLKLYDMRGRDGCSDNPLSELIKRMQSSEEFIVLVEKSVLPLQIARLLGLRYGYTVDIVEEDNELYKLRFTKRTG